MRADYYLTTMSRTSSFSKKTKNFQRIPRSVTFSGRSMGETEGQKERVACQSARPAAATNHVVESSSEVRRARMDCVLLSRSSHATPRSASYSRPKPARSQSARPPRSNSANRLREQAEADEKEKRAMAEAAFQAWIKRKADMPRQPRASPSREQIEQYTKEDARQRVLNQWHLRGVQRTKPETRSPSSPKENGSSNGGEQ